MGSPPLFVLSSFRARTQPFTVYRAVMVLNRKGSVDFSVSLSVPFFILKIRIVLASLAA